MAPGAAPEVVRAALVQRAALRVGGALLDAPPQVEVPGEGRFGTEALRADTGGHRRTRGDQAGALQQHTPLSSTTSLAATGGGGRLAAGTSAGRTAALLFQRALSVAAAGVDAHPAYPPVQRSGRARGVLGVGRAADGWIKVAEIFRRASGHVPGPSVGGTRGLEGLRVGRDKQRRAPLTRGLVARHFRVGL